MSDASGKDKGRGYFAHETAVIDEPCQIGEGTRIWHFCHVMKDCRIGPDCTLGQNVFVASGVEIGPNVKVQNNVSIYQGVKIEADVFVGPSVVFTNVSTPRAQLSRRHAFEQTLVCQGATIGANATVICGHTIGRFAFVAAGAVVTRDVSPHCLVMGNPARPAGWMCSCGARLNEEMTCRQCGRRFSMRGGELEEVASDG